ncbi:MAG: ABC transporter ATP-binding protein [Thermodesulfovibrionales bacterium]
MTDIAIRVENLSKKYHIGRKQDKYRTLRDTLADAFVSPFRKAGKLLRGQATGAAELDETIWALKDVSFEVKQGEVVGIIGRNGAGKSTLLKILSRITEPTKGYAEIHGRVGSLLEVGTGFHHELTGRENIYLNGAILGMKKAEIDKKFDEIVAFAEVEKFIDTPVKHYSSGMYLRLAFAVAAHLEPEILLVDEVLAVGDAEFQKKCIKKMGRVSKEGRTVLFVSHNMLSITQLCTKAFWLENGQIKINGVTNEVVASYLSSGIKGQAVWFNSSVLNSDLEVKFISARLLSSDNQPTGVVHFDEPFKVEISYEIIKPIRNLSIAYQLFDSHGNLVFESMDSDMPDWKDCVREPGQYSSICEAHAFLLKPGRYYLSIVSFIERIKIIEHQEKVLTFDLSTIGYNMNPGRLGIVSPVFFWEVTKMNGKKTD